jgi:D-glycero-D-manno-heptose 1,7-bisphosphate phosphatase
MSRRAVFLDKDGTLVDDVPMNVDPDRITLRVGAAEALGRLRDAGFHFAVVSNQAGVALGAFPERALHGVADRLRALLDAAGVSLDGFFYCPHHPAGTVAEYQIECDCRKPAPGLVLTAARELEADPANCWMVGDILDDVEAGRRAGCRTVLLDCGGETRWITTPVRTPDFIASTLGEAADHILAAERGR